MGCIGCGSNEIEVKTLKKTSRNNPIDPKGIVGDVGTGKNIEKVREKVEELRPGILLKKK